MLTILITRASDFFFKEHHFLLFAARTRVAYGFWYGMALESRVINKVPVCKYLHQSVWQSESAENTLAVY